MCKGRICPQSLKLPVSTLLPDDEDFDLPEILSEIIEINKIKRLFVSAEYTIKGHQVLWSIIQQCTNTLEELVFDPFYAPEVADREPVDWSLLTSLRVFSTRIEVYSDPNTVLWDVMEPFYSFRWLTKLLNQLSSSNKCLEELTIQVNHDICDPEAMLPYWNELIDMLLDRVRFPNLRKVDIKLGSYGKDEQDLLIVLEKHAVKSRVESDSALNVSLHLAKVTEDLQSFYPQLLI
ncbi:hypothetical protein CPB84DRAFT_1409987 [Gymnopilus junonius]|uniref:Uncharacterized protein n=1 Tax=Gymnopilus junonius TaxID=109634 RepID=A0A9P5NK17_GYMJU|nr:hypothetical protein CPB84DRAFT_1409987 [Gymnopilus junonius]